MPITPHLVEQAANFLKNNSVATPKQKLIIAGKLLRAAMISPKDWTPELLERVTTAYKALLRGNNVKKSVEQMDDKDASRYLKQFTRDVTQLAADIEQARSKQPRTRKS